MESEDYIFISYSRHDAAFAKELALLLRRNGYKPWIDVEMISPGENWQNRIEDSLEKSSTLIFVISPNSAKSVWALREFSVIAQKGKRVLPIMLEETDYEDIPENIRDLQWIDFSSSFSKGMSTLLKALQDTPRSKEIIQKPKTKSKGYAFISYAEEDTDFVKPLKEFLKNRGYAFWDYQESDRDYHKQLFLELEGVIIEASTTLSVLSESWKKSPWTVKEYFFSEEVNTPVFLLKAKQMSPTLAIAGMPYIDFTNNTQKGYQKLDKELKRKKL